MEKSFLENNFDVINEEQYQKYKNPENAPETTRTIDKDVSASQGAIDPNTGEINWDCPCLKEAIAPPCGEYFKAAFSCFVKSQTTPKGEDCMDLFVAMQSCYMAHSEIYKPIDDDNLVDSSHDRNINITDTNTATIS